MVPKLIPVADNIQLFSFCSKIKNIIVDYLAVERFPFIVLFTKFTLCFKKLDLFLRLIKIVLWIYKSGIFRTCNNVHNYLKQDNFSVKLKNNNQLCKSNLYIC